MSKFKGDEEFFNPKYPVTDSKVGEILATNELTPPLPDAVNQPSHYTDGGVEVIDFIEAKKLGYNLGNAVKYISRAGKKGGPEKKLEDLKKAAWYLAREIDSLS